MRLREAIFFVISGLDSFEVRFQPDCVTVALNGKELRRFENLDGRYKPCMTHCKDLINKVLQKPQASHQAAQRHHKDARPLTVFRG